MRGVLRVGLAILTGIVMAKAVTNVPVLAPVCLVPLLIAMMAPQAGAPLRARAVVGLGFLACLTFGVHAWGIQQYGWPIYGASAMYLAATGALFGALAIPALRARSRAVRVGGVTAAWVLAEFTRTLGAYSYPVLLGPCLADYPVLAQLGAVGGPWALEALVALMAALLAEAAEAWWIRDHPWLRPSRPLRPLLAAALLANLVVFGGAVRLGSAPELTDAPEPGERTLTVSIAQGGVPTWLYRRADVLDRLHEVIVKDYLALLDEALLGRPDWVVLPESAFGKPVAPSVAGLSEVPGLAQRRLGDTTLLLGTIHRMERFDPAYPAANLENAVVAITQGPEGLEQTGRITKRRLVPIAEARFRPADDWQPLATPQAQAGAQVCFESMYPEISRRLTRGGAEVLVVVLNDAGLRWSPNPGVHARLGVLRSIETGLPLVHAGQAGISFVTDAYGRKTRELGLFERGVLTARIRPGRVPSLYALTGDWSIIAFILLWVGCVFASLRVSAKLTE